MAELADKIERAGDENGVIGCGFGEDAVEGLLGFGNDGKTGGVVAGDFGELRGGNGAGGARSGEDDFLGAGEEEPRDFVDGFVAESTVDEPDSAAGEILLEKGGEFSGGGGIVRAVEINVGMGLKFFEAAGPHYIGDTLGYGFVGDSKAAVL